MNPERHRCPRCNRVLNRPYRSCVACDWMTPPENVLPPNPAGVDALGLRVNAAVLSGKLRWSSVAFTVRGTMSEMADLFQGRAPDDPDMRILIEAILDDCGG